MIDNFVVLSSIAYLCVVSPIITFLYTGRSKIAKATWILLGIIAVIFAIKLSYDLSNFPKNYYKVLEVPRRASPWEIRKAYHAISKKLHPDKSTSVDAEARFEEMKAIYDVSTYC